MSLTLPKLQIRLAITNQDGTPTTAFHRFFTVDFAGAIERNDAQQQATLEQLALQVQQIQNALETAQIALQTANNAQGTADDAVGVGTVSGSASDPAVNLLSDGVWVLGPQVDLSSVLAGNLTITGSGPQNDSDVDVTGISSGEWRIVEVEMGVDTTVFSGTFKVSKTEDSVIVVNNSAIAASTFSLSRTNTGSISYRLDARKVSGLPIYSLLLYAYARRAA